MVGRSQSFTIVVLLLASAIGVQSFATPFALSDRTALQLRSGQQKCSTSSRGLSLSMVGGSEAAVGASVTSTAVAEKVSQVADKAVAAADQATATAVGDQIVGPAVQVVGKSFSGVILIAVPIVGGIIVFSIIAWIIANTFYMPTATVTKEEVFNRKE